jgi:diacylglycerol kinase
MKTTNTFIYAANGIIHSIKHEFNLRVHLLATIIVSLMGFYFCISTTEWLFVIGCCMMVLSLELLNTAIENLCNLVSKEYHPVIKVVKDTAAASVLVSAIGSVVVGTIIFLPKIISSFK